MKHINAQFCQGVRTPAAALRRRVARVAAFAMTALALVGGVALAPQVTYAEEAALTEPAHTKTVTKNDDGTYTVSLNVTGSASTSSGEIVKNQPLDIVLVLDVSGSMDDRISGRDSVRKIDALKTAVNNFIEATAKENASITDEAQLNQIALVKFAGDKSDKVGNDHYEDWPYTYNNTQIVANLTSDFSEMTDEVSKLDAAGATAADWGFEKAEAALVNSRPNAKKVVIFFTDGEPNHDSGFSNNVANAAVAKAKSLKDAGVTIYSIGVFSNADPDNASTYDNNRFNAYMHAVSSNYPNATKWNQLGTRAENSSYYKAATNASDLNNIFESIREEIKTTTEFTGVTVYDKLSKWVTFANVTAEGKPDFKYYTKTGDNKPVEWEGATPAEVKDGLISWPVVNDETVLKEGVTYIVTFTVEATQEAYDDAASLIPTKDAQSPEAEENDPNEDNANSYFTNDNAQAKVTYKTKVTTNGDSVVSGLKDTYYNKPTITLPVSTITVNKVWAGSETNPGSVTIQLKQKQGNTDIVYGSVELNASNLWTHTFNVPAGPEGHEYTVEETAVDNYDTTYEGTYGNETFENKVKLIGLTEQKASVTVTNTLAVADLMITKVVDGSAANTSQHFTFNLDAGTLNGDYEVEYNTSDDGHAKTVTFEDGKAKLQLKHNETVKIKGLPKTTVVKISESGLDKSVTVATKVDDATSWTTLKKVAGDESMTQQRDVTVGVNTSVKFQNTTNLVPVLGVFTSSAPMIGLLVVALIGGSILAATEGKRAFGKHGGHGWKE